MAVEITEEFVWQNIPPRARDSHKGTFGSVLAVANFIKYLVETLDKHGVPGRCAAGSRGCTAHRGGYRYPCKRRAGGQRRCDSSAGVLPVPL